MRQAGGDQNPVESGTVERDALAVGLFTGVVHPAGEQQRKLIMRVTMLKCVNSGIVLRVMAQTGLQDRSAEPQFDSSPQCLQQKPVAFDDL